MDWLTFITEITKTLVWPATIVALVSLLRSPLVALIPGLRRLKWKELELDFEKRIEEIEKKAAVILLTQDEIESFPPVQEYQLDRFAVLAEISPPAAILESWLDVEMALQEAALRHDIPVPQSRSPVSVARELVRQGKLDPQTMAILNDLRSLRNEAVHVSPTAITVSQAREFRDLALRLAAKLRQL